MSRDKILTAIKAGQPEFAALPEVTIPQNNDDLVGRFTATAAAVGCRVLKINSTNEIRSALSGYFNSDIRILAFEPELSKNAGAELFRHAPHTLDDVDLAIIRAEIGVAENGALWVPEENAMHRVLPFITQHLALVVEARSFVPTMHQAYELIDKTDYGYGVFISGPSKTADIEQSLVYGAHGARTLSVFILDL